MGVVGDELGATGEPQPAAAGEPRGDSPQEAREVCQGPGGGLGSASSRRLGGVQGAPWVSQVPAPQLWGDPAKETEKVCQRPIGSSERGGSGGGLGPSSHRPFGEGRGDQELGASGGDSLGSGPQSREPSPKETEEVSQGHGAPGGLPSASRPPLVGLGGCQELAASGGSAGSGPQLKGDSADKTGEVCQGSRELPSVTHQGLGWMHSGQELGPT